MTYAKGDRVIVWANDKRVVAGLDVSRYYDIRMAKNETAFFRLTDAFGRYSAIVTFKRDWPLPWIDYP